MHIQKKSCNDDKCVDEVILSIASSKRSLAVCLYSGADSGIHPMSGLDGEERCSLVVIILSPLVFVTNSSGFLVRLRKIIINEK